VRVGFPVALPPASAAEDVLRARVRRELAGLYAGQTLPCPSLRERLRHVLVVASSSRCGSSLLVQLLRHCDSLLHLRGEINPLLWVGGLSYPASGSDSDALDETNCADALALQALDGLLAWECGRPETSLATPEARRDFSRDLAARLLVQWPTLSFSAEHVYTWVEDTLRHLVSEKGWPSGRFRSTSEFHIAFLRRVRREHPFVNPYYYDLPFDAVRSAFPEVRPPAGPPGPVLIEEPPFVMISPWHRPSVEELAARTLVIKTPSNAYRMSLFGRLFPHARIKVLHLTRNAAASANGLYDGWLHHGFFSHRVRDRLSIQGYSNLLAPWSSHWWKFDLPPGWQAYRDAPLEEVCVFQWRSAHQAILDYLREHRDTETLRMRFEDVSWDATRRVRTMSRLLAWLGTTAGPGCRAAFSALPEPVMATRQPGRFRWRQRQEVLLPIVRRREVQALMDDLGYERDPAAWA
jgi:hypothetical protein